MFKTFSFPVGNHTLDQFSLCKTLVCGIQLHSQYLAGLQYQYQLLDEILFIFKEISLQAYLNETY